ncbi:MAG: GH3 auxin-responsive promoter family protein [Gemmataceae bacterium]|nr:GH3 auxin-responsive promoter family protein [Gemmataceae bacterium]MDW8242990.1 GH3 auxin-responsive promoter family protein [Thermogemmata sp.]
MFAAPLVSSLVATPPLRRLADTLMIRHAHIRARQLDALDVAQVQKATLLQLVRRAATTRFGREHDFARISSVADYQVRVPLRYYEDFWHQYWKDVYPHLEGITWPERIPYYALSSGTTTGATKYIPVSWDMVRSNRKAAFTTTALFRHVHPEARLLTGKFFFVGGSTALRPQADGSRAGDLSGIAAREFPDALRPYTFPPLSLALIANWEEKLQRLAETSLNEPITAISGIPAWLLVLFGKLKQLSGKKTIAEIWPQLRLVIHGGTSFEPYRHVFRREIGSERVHFCEVYPASEGFVATEDPRYQLLRVIPDHGIFFEFVPVDDLDRSHPPRHTLANVETGVNYAVVLTTCAGLWSYILGDTVVFERRTPPLLRFTGRTKYFLSAFGEHLISEEVEKAVAAAARVCGVDVVDFHVGPVFPQQPHLPGHHLYLVECADRLPDPRRFAQAIDAELMVLNEDYAPHRQGDLAMRLPEVRLVRAGGFAAWMKAQGKYGGQHKVPRMDNSGQLTARMLEWFQTHNWLVPEHPEQ